MTREEQIKEAARQRADQYDHPSKWSDTYYGFIDGAKWADQHPQMKPENKLQDFKKEVEGLRNIADAEEYAKQLAHLFLDNGLSLHTILLMAIDFGQQRPNWTPVDERLPEERQVVWVRKHFKRKYVGEFDLYDSAAFCNGEFQCDASGNVTHWMEVVPPQGKEG